MFAFSDYRLSSRPGTIMMPLAREFNAGLYLQDDSIAVVQSLQRMGHPEYADLSSLVIPGVEASTGDGASSENFTFSDEVPSVVQVWWC